MKKKSFGYGEETTNYFPLPNEIYTLDLSAGEIAVYGYLLYCEDRKTYKCHPSYKTIGKAIKMSKNTVRKYIKSLEKKRLINTEPTKIICKDGRQNNGSLLYTINPIGEAVEYNFAFQLRRNEEIRRKESFKKKFEKFGS